jgi:hypothetical protein
MPAPTTTIPAPTPTAPNPDVVPGVITPAYVNAVFAVLNHVYGNATRALVQAHAVTAEVKADLRAIFNDPLYQQQLQAAQASLSGAINNVRPNPGDLVTQTIQIQGSSNSCIFVKASTLFTSVERHPTPAPADTYYQLSPKDPGNDPDGLNSTPWAMTENLVFFTPTTVRSSCA